MLISLNQLFLLEVLSWSATFATVFGVALRLGPKSFNRIREHPRLFIRTLLVVWLAIPLFTAFTVIVFRVTGQSATIMLLMAVCPGVPVLLAEIRTVRGAIATAFLALILTASTEPLMIPYWARILSKFLPVDLSVQPRHVLDVLIPTVFLPMVLGFSIGDISSRVTQILERISDYVYLIGVCGCYLNILIKGWPILAHIPLRAYLAVLVVTIGDTIFGYWAGSPKLENQKAVALAAALGNPALALTVIEASYRVFLEPAVVVSAYLVVRTLILLPIELLLRSWEKRHAETGA